MPTSMAFIALGSDFKTSTSLYSSPSLLRPLFLFLIFKLRIGTEPGHLLNRNDKCEDSEQLGWTSAHPVGISTGHLTTESTLFRREQ